MIEVEFLHDYANAQTAFTKGQRTELSESQIAFFEIDSPGCLKRINSAVEDKAVRKPKMNKMIESVDEDKAA